MGIGLWAAKSWGFRAVFGGTLFYTLERFLYLRDSDARTAESTGALDGLGALLDGDTMGWVTQAISLSTIVSIVCWWAFVLYLWRRKDYFQSGPAS